MEISWEIDPSSNTRWRRNLTIFYSGASENLPSVWHLKYLKNIIEFRWNSKIQSVTFLSEYQSSFFITSLTMQNFYDLFSALVSTLGFFVLLHIWEEMRKTLHLPQCLQVQVKTYQMSYVISLNTERYFTYICLNAQSMHIYMSECQSMHSLPALHLIQAVIEAKVWYAEVLQKHPRALSTLCFQESIKVPSYRIVKYTHFWGQQLA